MIDVRFRPMDGKLKDPLGRTRYLKSPFSSTSMDDLDRELRKLEARDIVIESGHKAQDIRNDGWPRGGSSPEHHGVRLYFACKHGQLRYECDAFSDWRANLRAIGLWLQRQRLAIEEWGIGSGGEAYRGFAALPAGSAPATEWAHKEDAARFLIQTAGVAAPSAVDIQACVSQGVVLKAWYNDAAKAAHPDRQGGAETLMARVNRARDFIAGAGGGAA